MSNTDLVRASRDGDQFHYWWAARRCLRLLDPKSDLSVVSIEGASSEESENSSVDEIIDVAEYFGGETIGQASKIVYYQLKHSTARSTEIWTLGEIKDVIEKFAKKYDELITKGNLPFAEEQLSFVFVSNRFVEDDLIQGIQKIANREAYHASRIENGLRNYAKLSDDKLSNFCKCLKFECGVDNFLQQRSTLFTDIEKYLPDRDTDAPLALKELVTQKATSEFVGNPTISKVDVLRSFKIDESDIFPAPSKITHSNFYVHKAKDIEVIKLISNTQNNHILITASGGAGKTAFTTQMGQHLTNGSKVVVYDCFGSGDYRRPTSPRHAPRQALVQIANELAVQGLCDVLIPSVYASDSSYFKAFKHRLLQSLDSLQEKNSKAQLWIVIDAADNAEMAAANFGYGVSFARALLREEALNDIKFIFLCRPERISLLDAPPNLLKLELYPFSLDETNRFLAHKYQNTSSAQAREFHRLTSGNPRLQAMVTESAISLEDVLASLGSDALTIDEAIERQLRLAVESVRDSELAKEDIEGICKALAILPPLIPISAISKVADVSVEAISSFASDLASRFGSPILITDHSVQFRDEPVETWFRSEFYPKVSEIRPYIERLRPFIKQDIYIASSLPRLMLEANQLRELIDYCFEEVISLENDEMTIQQWEVQVKTIQLALKACLREKDYFNAAKLAFKGGGLMQGEDRLIEPFRKNMDLLAQFLPNDNAVLEFSQKTNLRSDWIGSHHIYIASLLSYIEAYRGNARSHVRVANEWIRDFSQKNRDGVSLEGSIKLEDITEFSTAILNIEGAEYCAKDLMRWSPKKCSYVCGKAIAKKLLDTGQFEAAYTLAKQYKFNIRFVAGVCVALRNANLFPPQETVFFLLKRAIRLKMAGSINSDELVEFLRVINMQVECSAHYVLENTKNLVKLIDQYLPNEFSRVSLLEHDEDYRVYLRGYALRETLSAQPLSLEEKKPSALKENNRAYERERAIWDAKIKPIFLLEKVHAKKILANILPNKDLLIEEAQKEMSLFKPVDASRLYEPNNHVVLAWLKTINCIQREKEEHLDSLKKWIAKLQKPLFTSTWIELAKIAFKDEIFSSFANECLNEVYSTLQNEQMDAEEKVELYFKMCRVLMAYDATEAQACFNKAISVANNELGGDVPARWEAILDVTDAISENGMRKPKLAYELSRYAELTYKFVVRAKHFDCYSTIESIARLCPSTCFAVLSRWRDKRLFQNRPIFVSTIEKLLSTERLDGKYAIALTPYSQNWSYANLLDIALPQLENKDQKKRVSNWILKYIKLTSMNASLWHALKSVADKNELDIDQYNEIISFLESEKPEDSKENFKDAVSHDGAVLDWIFYRVDLTNPSDITATWMSFNKHINRGSSSFARELFKRANIFDSAQIVEALSSTQATKKYFAKDFLEAIPESWKIKISVQNALKQFAKKVAQLSCIDIDCNRVYQSLPLPDVETLTGLSKNQFLDEVFNALGHHGESFDSRRLFSLIRLLVHRLNVEEAEDLLEFSFSLLSPFLTDKDGDGDWSESLDPGRDVGDAIAGYIVSGLASPVAAERWKSAHTIRGLAWLGDSSTINKIVNLVDQTNPQQLRPYNYSKFYYYQLHAKLWTAIALARIAQENPEVVSSVLDRLKKWAFDDEPHVVIRYFSAQALISLKSKMSIDLLPEQIKRLECINEEKKSSLEKEDKALNLFPGNEPLGSERGALYFDYDFRAGWLESLAELFNQSVESLELGIKRC